MLYMMFKKKYFKYLAFPSLRVVSAGLCQWFTVDFNVCCKLISSNRFGCAQIQGELSEAVRIEFVYQFADSCKP